MLSLSSAHRVPTEGEAVGIDPLWGALQIPSSRIPSQDPDSAPLHGESASGFSIDLGVVLYV